MNVTFVIILYTSPRIFHIQFIYLYTFTHVCRLLCPLYKQRGILLLKKVIICKSLHHYYANIHVRLMTSVSSVNNKSNRQLGPKDRMSVTIVFILSYAHS